MWLALQLAFGRAIIASKAAMNIAGQRGSRLSSPEDKALVSVGMRSGRGPGTTASQLDSASLPDRSPPLTPRDSPQWFLGLGKGPAWCRAAAWNLTVAKCSFLEAPVSVSSSALEVAK